MHDEIQYKRVKNTKNVRNKVPTPSTQVNVST